ncbi:MAG: LysR family transcriptional regulator [Pseudomonadota bacterium]
MAERAASSRIDLQLVKVLHTVISERSVSKAAMKLRSTQPAVSAQLKRLRELTGDALLVRTGAGLVPTERALQMLDDARCLLDAADRLFNPRQRAGAEFDPAQARIGFRVAASDYLDPFFLPELVAHVKRLAPQATLDLHGLSEEFDYRRSLAAGDVDLVIGNWLQPPAELHLGKLFSDEIVCLVAQDHPALRAAQRGAWTVERYLGSEHVAPAPLHLGARGVIDEHLANLGLQRRVAVRSAHFSLIPLMVARSLLVLTTGRQFCQRYLDALPLRVVPCPVAFPPLAYYQLWHDRSHGAAAMRWLREQVRVVAQGLAAAGGRLAMQ